MSNKLDHGYSDNPSTIMPANGDCGPRQAASAGKSYLVERCVSPAVAGTGQVGLLLAAVFNPETVMDMAN